MLKKLSLLIVFGLTTVFLPFDLHAEDFPWKDFKTEVVVSKYDYSYNLSVTCLVQPSPPSDCSTQKGQSRTITWAEGKGGSTVLNYVLGAQYQGRHCGVTYFYGPDKEITSAIDNNCASSGPKTITNKEELKRLPRFEFYQLAIGSGTKSYPTEQLSTKTSLNINTKMRLKVYGSPDITYRIPVSAYVYRLDYDGYDQVSRNAYLETGYTIAGQKPDKYSYVYITTRGNTSVDITPQTKLPFYEVDFHVSPEVTIVFSPQFSKNSLMPAADIEPIDPITMPTKPQTANPIVTVSPTPTFSPKPVTSMTTSPSATATTPLKPSISATSSPKPSTSSSPTTSPVASPVSQKSKVSYLANIIEAIKHLFQ